MAQDWYDWGTLGTLTGAAGVVVIVANTVRAVIGLSGPYVPFIVSIAVSYIGAAASHRLEAWPDWVLAFFNGCLLFCTAAGGQEILVKGSEAKPPPAPTLQGPRRVPWLSSWLP